MKRKVVIGLLGTTLDAPKSAERWNRWRPTVSLFQHEELLFDRFDLIYPPRSKPLAELVSKDIYSISPETTVSTHCIEFGDAWDFQSVYGQLYDFARTYPFNQDEEDYWIHITTGTHVAQICLFLLTESRHLPAKLIQTAPPKRSEAIGSFAMIDLDLSRYDQLAARFNQEQIEGQAFLKSGIETRNKAFNKLIEEIEYIAIQSKSPILLTGPTGAGKSQLAKNIYRLKESRRQITGKFVEINCGTIKGDAAMSTLFGHVKGSYTGAVNDRPGLLKEADKGIIFLDEIGELGLDEQAMLLRALEDKKFMPLGSDNEASSDFQLISGTNKNLLKATREGAFRRDLLARINLWSYELPGLKDRREDIDPNIEYELNNYSHTNRQSVKFNKEALEQFRQFAQKDSSIWSGNFRDLNAAITRMATLASGKRINTEIVKKEISKLHSQWREDPSNDSSESEILSEIFSHKELESIDMFDRPQLAGVINICRSSKSLSDAGRKLYNVSREKRKTSNDADRLRKYLSRFELSWDRIHKT